MTHYCADCGGTGRDDRKTAQRAKDDAEFAHRVKHHGTYINCWACNGNGPVCAKNYGLPWGVNAGKILCN